MGGIDGPDAGALVYVGAGAEENDGAVVNELNP
jgi:hypothetical protein